MNLNQWIGKIEKEVRAIAVAYRDALGHAKAAGKMLADARPQCSKDGMMWRDFCSACGVQERTANNYIRIAQGWAKIEKAMKEQKDDAPPMTVREALAVLKGKTTRNRTKAPPVPTDRHKTTLTVLLYRHGVQASPERVLAVLGELGIDLGRVLRKLDTLATVPHTGGSETPPVLEAEAIMDANGDIVPARRQRRQRKAA